MHQVEVCSHNHHPNWIFMNSFAKRLVRYAKITILATQCFRGAYGAEAQTAPWVIELYRSQHALRMTLNMLPMCSQDDWDAQTLTKVAQILAQYRFESLSATNLLHMETPNLEALRKAKDRSDELLKETLNRDQITELFKLKLISEIIEQQSDDADKAFTLVCGDQLMKVFDRVEEITDWEITTQDVHDVLIALRDEPKLANASIQSALGTLQDVLKRHPQKAAALAKQLTSTLKKADVGL